GGRSPGGVPSDDSTSAMADSRPVCVRMIVPTPVRAAFDEALEIHRAVTGHDGGIATFVEHLVAEAHAGLRPPDVDLSPVRPSEDEAARREDDLARRSDDWGGLDASVEPRDAIRLARDLLIEIERVSARPGHGS